MKQAIPVRLILVEPAPGVLYGVQVGKAGVATTVRSAEEDLVFDVSLTLAGKLSDGRPRFVGEFAQGPADERFVYLCIGKSAGDLFSPWTRRAKLHLAAITWEMVEEAIAKPGAVISARFPGKAKDGGPSCASIRPLEGWVVV